MSPPTKHGLEIASELALLQFLVDLPAEDGIFEADPVDRRLVVAFPKNTFEIGPSDGRVDAPSRMSMTSPGRKRTTGAEFRSTPANPPGG